MLADVIAAKARRASAAPVAVGWRREVDVDGTRYGVYDYACGDGTSLRIDESYSSTGTRVWDMSVAMARLLERHAGDASGDALRVGPRGTRVLELGAGSGLLGMALAKVGADVTMTEIREVVPHLQGVVDANRGALGGAAITVRALDWRESPVADEFKGFPVVVASDVLICDQWAGDLAKVLVAVAASARLVLVGTARRRDGIPRFLDAVAGAFDVDEVPGSDFDPAFAHADLQVFRLRARGSIVD